MVVEPEVKRRVVGKIDQKKDEIISFLQDLVKVPSLSGEEGSAQDLVAKKFEQIPGLEIDIWEPSIEKLAEYPLHPLRLTPWSYKNRPNVVGTLKGKGAGSSLILNGHIDVVSPEPVKAWKIDPWSATIEDGRIYGRGACDMKGGIAAMTYSVLSILEVGIELKGQVILESVIEEEYGGGGTIATLLRGYKADAAIVTEGTGSQELCMGAGGSRFFRVNVLGRSEVAHRAHLGVNAITLAAKLCDSLLELNEHRVTRLQGKHTLFEKQEIKSQLGTGRPTSLTLGILRAGDWPSTVAGWAEIQGRLGFPPSERGEDVEKEIEETISKSAEQDPWMRGHPPTVQWWGPRKEGYVLSPDDPIVKQVKGCVEQVTGKCEIYATPTNSDVNYLVQKVGAYGGIPAVMFGPGGANLHGANEYVVIDEVVTIAKVLSLAILEWCGYEL